MEQYSAQIDMDRRNLDGREAVVRLSAFMHASTGAGPSRYRSVQQRDYLKVGASRCLLRVKTSNFMIFSAVGA
jgi:hypothetical protein